MDAHVALLQGEDKYPEMLVVLGLMEPRLKKRGFQSLKTPSPLSPLKRLQHAVNDMLRFVPLLTCMRPDPSLWKNHPPQRTSPGRTMTKGAPSYTLLAEGCVHSKCKGCHSYHVGG